MEPRTRIHRGPDGHVRVQLPEHERELLREIAEELEMLLQEEHDDPALQRLFPEAHEDPDRQREFAELTRPQLAAGKARAVEILRETSNRDQLSPEEADAWLRALNDARLVLGTRAEVTEDLDWDAFDERHPNAPQLAVYAYLSWIQEELVAAVGMA